MGRGGRVGCWGPVACSAWLPVALLLGALAAFCRPGDASKLDEEPELVVEQVKQEAELEVRYKRLRQEHGLDDPRTLEVFFQLFDLWIMLYRLNKADAALAEIVPICELRQDQFQVKAVQALAFTRWKQGRHREALQGFHRMEGWVGRSPALCENVGHTYNQLGEYADAERYFREAIKLNRQLTEETRAGEGGMLLGLSGVQERRGLPSEALPLAMQAYAIFQAEDTRRGWKTSLSAKAAMSVSALQVKLGGLEDAQAFALEALQNFEETSGEDSPLVVGPLRQLATVHLARGQAAAAKDVLHRAYRVASIKDALDMVEIAGLHTSLIQAHLADVEVAGLDKAAFRTYFSVVDHVAARVRAEQVQDGNAGLYFKYAGEVRVLGGDCDTGSALLVDGAELLARDTSVDTSGLVKEALDLLAYCGGSSAPDGPGGSPSSGQTGHPTTAGFKASGTAAWTAPVLDEL